MAYKNILSLMFMVEHDLVKYLQQTTNSGYSILLYASAVIFRYW